MTYLAAIAVASTNRVPSPVEGRRIDVGYFFNSVLFKLAQAPRRSGARHGLGVVADDGEHHRRLLRSLSHCLRRCRPPPRISGFETLEK